MQGLLQDLRFAVRGLARRPGFAVVVLLTLALGIGVNSAIFSIVYGVLLRPLPYAGADRLVRLWQRLPAEGIERAPVSPPDFVDWRDQSDVFSSIACFAPSFATLTGKGEPQELQAVRVSADLFRLLAARPAQGRGLLGGEDQAGAAPVAVLSNRLWQRHFGGRSDLAHASLVLDGVNHRVVGVMPPDFNFEDGDLWLPLVFTPSDQLARGRAYLGVVARLKDGVSLRQAQSAMDTIAGRLALEHPSTNTRSLVGVVPLYEQIVSDIRPTLLLLMTAVGFVLLIACANVSNLLLARITDRRGEIGTRLALGASRARLVRSTITETLVLALMSGLASLLLSRWLIAWLVHLKPPNVPRLAEVRLDLPVMLFTLLASLVAGLLFGWGPAVQTAGLDAHELLKEGAGRTGVAGGRLRLRDSLAVIELALTLVLLVGSGLLVRSFQHLLAVDPGFRPQNVVTGFIALPRAEYAGRARQLAFAEQVLQSLQGLPDVRAAAVATSLPFGRVNMQQSFHVEGETSPPDKPPVGVVDGVTPEFFRTMGIAVVRGRTIRASDRAPAPPVVVIDQTLAKLWFPRGDAVGRRLILLGLSREGRQIVGVVRAVKRYGLDADSNPQIYVPLDSAAGRYVSLVMRTGSDPSALGPALRRAVWSVDPNLPVQVATLESALEDSLAQTRFTTRLISVLGLLAIILAVMGLYAVMAYSVARRRHEIGVRMAIGGQRAQILQLVMRQALVLTVIGIAIGLLSSLAMTRLVAGLLFGVTPTDPATFVAVSLLLGAVALGASFLPARRATRVDPVIALRTE